MGLDMYIELDNDWTKTESMYWRKANAIHQYFVDTIQWWEDDCRYHLIDIDTIEDLLDRCEKILEREKDILSGKTKIAKSLLPTQDWFFFGSIAYDEHYMQDIKDCIKWIKEHMQDFKNWKKFYYISSW